MVKKRFLNFCIDSLVVLVLTLLILGLVNNLLDGNIKHITTQPILHLLYYIFMESLFNRTVGKYFTKTKIEFKGNMQKKIVLVVFRTLSRIIPFEPFSIFFNKECIMWHDKISKTKVVESTPDARSLSE